MLITIVKLHCMHVLHAGSQCIEHSVQLVGELSQHTGSPVICFGGSWKKVCYTNDKTAGVICGQLGFSREGNLMSCILVSVVTVYTIKRFSFPDPTVYYDFIDPFYYNYHQSIDVWLPLIENVRCPTNETQVSQCEYLHTRISSCN